MIPPSNFTTMLFKRRGLKAVFCRQIVRVCLPMNDILKILPPATFILVHKSYIISLNHIGIIERARVLINSSPIPIGITYREQFSRVIRNNNKPNRNA